MYADRYVRKNGRNATVCEHYWMGGVCMGKKVKKMVI